MGCYRESKEEIKDSMIQTALAYWNIRKIENLDPLVRLLIEALSMQLHNISDEIADIEVRTIRRMSEVLLPEVSTAVSPAHAVVHVDVVSEGLKTSMFDGFSSVATTMGRRDGRNCSFYPVCETELRKGNVSMVVVENSVYEILPDQNKRILLKKQTLPENVNKVFVGLEFEDKNVDLSHLSLYFDFPNIDRRRDYLHSLSSAQWRVKGDDLSVRRGLHSVSVRPGGELKTFFETLDNNHSVNANVLDYYKMSYVTIDSQMTVAESDFTKMPSGFMMDNKAEYTPVFNKDLLWIEINLPPQFTSSVLADIQVSINTFPVANKELRKVNSLVKKDFGVVPLPVNDYESFLDVIDVSDEYDTVYRRASGYKDEKSEKSYTLRQGGCEAFDKRDAREYLIRLQGVMEDELSRVSSSEIGRNAERVNLIEQLLKKIDRRIQKDYGRTEMPYYLFVEPQCPTSYFYIRYWTSYGQIANGMRIGQTLNPMGDSYGVYEHPIFLTTTTGGKNPPSERARIAKFKYILGSRNRIVTNNDIKNFCFSECDEEMTDVIISKGIGVSTDTECGLQRTIDISLILKNRDLNELQKRHLSDDLKEKLILQSPMTYNYRVFCE